MHMSLDFLKARRPQFVLIGVGPLATSSLELKKVRLTRFPGEQLRVVDL
jgi:hypothetical protein